MGDLSTEILGSIKIVAKSEVENYGGDKTYESVITAVVSTGLYSVYVNGSLYNISSSLTYNIGDKVMVKAPQNDFSKLYISSSYSSAGTGGGSINISNVINLQDELDSKLKKIDFPTYYNFPNLGDINTFYVDVSKNTTYRWSDADLKYYVVGSDYNDIKIINCGNATV